MSKRRIASVSKDTQEEEQEEEGSSQPQKRVRVDPEYKTLEQAAANKLEKLAVDPVDAKDKKEEAKVPATENKRQMPTLAEMRAFQQRVRKLDLQPLFREIGEWMKLALTHDKSFTVFTRRVDQEIVIFDSTGRCTLSVKGSCLTDCDMPLATLSRAIEALEIECQMLRSI